MSELFENKSKFLSKLPSKPGVYCMLGNNGNILYVGKAKNLKKRVPNYFQSEQRDRKTTLLMTKVCDIKLTITNTETEALILEYNLIKKNKPRYNVVLRDDKSYPYIYVATEHQFPRIEFQRRAKSHKGKYFGPYPNAAAVRETLTELQKVFLVRQCKDSFFKNRSRACLQYQIQRCSAPCVGLIEKNEYDNDVNSTMQFLAGKNKSIVNGLVKRMEQCSEQKKYEEALKYRNQISRLKEIQAKQFVSTSRRTDIDVLGIASDGVTHCVAILSIRNGSVTGNKNYYFKIRGATSRVKIQQEFLSQYYLSIKSPSEIIVPESVTKDSVLENLLSDKAQRKVRLTNNVRGNRLGWLDMAHKNAAYELQCKISSEASLTSQLVSLGKLFCNGDQPKRIECFDVSHISGEATVASCVVFNELGPLKSDYRRFNIKSSDYGDDYAALSEAVGRRYKRIKSGEELMPDILFLDGGKGQLSSCMSILQELNIKDIIVIAVAKGRSRKPGMEQLFLTTQNEPLNLAADSPVLHLIQRIRDEAHRFAITGHRQRRNINRKRSRLDGIEGLGPIRRRELLKQFGGIHGVMRAGVEDLSKINGISKAMSVRIFNNLHNHN
tara:strand:- start:193 stop:2019 length:1827 start_codon:yes stop_codon:yes gene_type:complete